MTRLPLAQPGRQVAFGLALLAAGLLAVLDRLQMFDRALLPTFWPLLLVGLGLVRLLRPTHAGSVPAGAALLIVGGMLTAHRLGYTGLHWTDVWPAFLLLGGLSMLLRGLRGGDRPGR